MNKQILLTIGLFLGITFSLGAQQTTKTVCLLDSLKLYSVEDGKIEESTYYTYDSRGNLISSIKDYGSYSNKIEMAYDDNGNPTLYAEYYKDSDSNNWAGRERKIELAWNEFGNKTLSISYTWDDDLNDWVGEEDRDYYWDEYDYMEKYGTIEYYEKLDYYRTPEDENNNYGCAKYEYFYDATGFPLYRLGYNYRKPTRTWDIVEKREVKRVGDELFYVTYNYNRSTGKYTETDRIKVIIEMVNGKYTLLTRYEYYDEDDNQWREGNKLEWTYDEKGNLSSYTIFELGYNYNSDEDEYIFSPKYRYEYTWNSDKSIASKTQYWYWDSEKEQWNEGRRTTYKHAFKGNYTEITKIKMELNSNDNKFHDTDKYVSLYPGFFLQSPNSSRDYYELKISALYNSEHLGGSDPNADPNLPVYKESKYEIEKYSSSPKVDIFREFSYFYCREGAVGCKEGWQQDNYETYLFFSNFSIKEENVQVKKESEGSIVISWTVIDDAHSYTLIIYSDAAHTQEVARFTLDASGNILRSDSNTLSCSISDLKDNETYFYSLTAYDAEEEMLSENNGNFINTNTAINSIDSDANIISVEYYNLIGTRLVTAPSQGVYIVKKYMSNGSVVVKKEIVK
ncbi:hypothetical protein M2138_001428 [Dysgonomonadaceae bacterium PH5-43]|nr:hypothetical protein [Dysgonomonadaceae bacterium PH5-43]